MKKQHHFAFFSEDLAGPDATIDPAELRHALAVLRMRNGAYLHLVDGKGWSADGVLDTSCGENNSTVIITDRKYTAPLPVSCTLAIGIPERDAFETILTEVTALGISRIHPVIMQYCQKPWWENWDKQMHRFRQIMITSLKQSHSHYLPILEKPCTLCTLLATTHTIKLVADPFGKPLYSLGTVFRNQSVICFIGPPGGFSEQETTLLIDHMIQPVQIAHHRLRTELAATTLSAQIIGYTL